MKSIIRCGCVCKSWYSLIRSRNFISTHFHKTKHTQPFLYQYAHNARPNNQISLIFHHPDKLDYRVFHLPTDPFFTFSVAGSCNGILCLAHQQYSSNLILLNPLIRHSLLVPMPQFVPLSIDIAVRGLLGFGFDDINRDYKILRIPKSSNHWVAELYSLNSNCWRDILAPIPNFNFCMGQNNIGSFVKGRLHWVVQDVNENINLILAFDLREETFHQLSLPEHAVSYKVECLKLIEFGESSVALIYEERGRGSGDPPLWVMREYGVAESWQSSSFDELEEIYLGCQPKDVNDDFIYMVDPLKKSSHLFMPSLELLDTQGWSS